VEGESPFTEESVLKSLTAMAGALAAGDVVTVEGVAAKDGETGAWNVVSLTVKTSGNDDGDGEFGGRVIAVAPDDDDPAIGTFSLINGRVYTIVEGESPFTEESVLKSLTAMAGALAAGDVVTVEGVATKDGETGAWNLVSLTVKTSGNDDGDGEFGGRVIAVAPDDDDPAIGTFTLINGRVYTIVEGESPFTEESVLKSLTAMAGALAAGDVVTVEGVATKDGETGAWNVVSLTVKTSGNDDGDGEFGGRVIAVAPDDDDPDIGTFSLINGRVYTIVEGESPFTEESVLKSLTAMAGALAAGDVVTVEGVATKDGETGAWNVVSLTVKTSGNDDGDGEFGGRVIAVAPDDDDPAIGTFTLINGRVYTIVEGESPFTEESVLKSLTAMAGALAAGDVVTVEGVAAKDGETGAWNVVSLTVKTSGNDDGDGEFGGRVIAVAPDDDDPAIGTFTLINGRVYTVTGGTEFDDEGNLTSLTAMAEALASGRIVTVEGTATQDSESGGWNVEKVKARRQGP
jgi:hypothetical protein